MSEITEKVDKLRETDIDDIPGSSRFLLEMNYGNLMKSNIHNKTYWVVAAEATINAGQRPTTGSRREPNSKTAHRNQPRRD